MVKDETQEDDPDLKLALETFLESADLDELRCSGESGLTCSQRL